MRYCALFLICACFLLTFVAFYYYYLSLSLSRITAIASDGVAWSVGLLVCLSVGHVREPCENGWTDRDAV